LALSEEKVTVAACSNDMPSYLEALD
jgi:hypothetical protein